MTDTADIPARIIELPASLDRDIQTWLALQAAKKQLAHDLTKLSEESDRVKVRIVTAMKVDDDVNTQENLIISRNQVPLLRATVFPTSSVDPAYLREFHPEIYTKALKSRQTVRLTAV
jgi:hypothetical protein